MPHNERQITKIAGGTRSQPVNGRHPKAPAEAGVLPFGFSALKRHRTSLRKVCREKNHLVVPAAQTGSGSLPKPSGGQTQERGHGP